MELDFIQGPRETEALGTIESLIQCWPSLAAPDSGWLRHTEYKGTERESGRVHYLTTWNRPTKEQPVGKATAGIWFTYGEPPKFEADRRHTPPTEPMLSYRFERQHRTHYVPASSLLRKWQSGVAEEAYQPEIPRPDRQLKDTMEDKMAVGNRFSELLTTENAAQLKAARRETAIGRFGDEQDDEESVNHQDSASERAGARASENFAGDRPLSPSRRVGHSTGGGTSRANIGSEDF